MASEGKDEYFKIGAAVSLVIAAGLSFLPAFSLFAAMTLPLLVASTVSGLVGLFCLYKDSQLLQKELDELAKTKEEKQSFYDSRSPSKNLEISHQIEIEAPPVRYVNEVMKENALQKKSAHYRY